jgi:capping protein beta
MQLHLPLFHPHLYTTTRHNNHELQHTLLLLRIPHKPPNQKHNGRPLRRRPVSRTTPPPQTTPPTNTPPPSDLLRRLPPSATAQNLAGIISLVPSLEEELLSSVDVGLTAKRCPASGRDYLCCDYNRDGDSYRSPWSNDFDPQIDPEDAADLIPRGRIRRMEESLNAAVDVYRELYYEGGVSSAYLWQLDEGFAGVVLVKKSASAGSAGGKAGGWDSIHVLEVSEAASKRSAHYKLTSTVILDLGMKSESVGGLELAGNLTRQQEQDLALHGMREAEVEQSHVANIGRMVEDMETRMRNLLQEVYFGKAKDVVGDLRSIRPLSEAEQERAQQREVIGKMNR